MPLGTEGQDRAIRYRGRTNEPALRGESYQVPGRRSEPSTDPVAREATERDIGQIERFLTASDLKADK